MPYYVLPMVKPKPQINLIKKDLEDNPRECDSLMSTVLWAYRMSKKSTTGVSLYMFTYGQEAMLPFKITLIYSNIDELGESRVATLEKLVLSNDKVAKAYNKHIKEKRFDVGNIVWKTILLTSMDDEKFGKWLPTWEGPYLVSKIFSENVYQLIEMEGKELLRTINGKFLKRYYPTM
ncbi:hypothetical protein ACJRO7_024726 [Eucalyptus globulus]|uniref:Uncharacterized protein n=1 Tax=Eucalyptus globulus TaxID=34317 RepID=A0ABD3KB33_EUCGL